MHLQNIGNFYVPTELKSMSQSFVLGENLSKGDAII